MTESVIVRSAVALPVLVSGRGEHASRRFLEFFTAHIRNRNTRAAYAQAVGQFLAWCDTQGVVDLGRIEPIMVAAYIEDLSTQKSVLTVKQHLAAIRALFDFLVTGQVVPFNPASSVRGPKYSTERGKTPVLSREDARLLLESIDTSDIMGLRDRALIGLMIFSFARVSAVVNCRVEDYYQAARKRWHIRLHEKGGKYHEVPVHHTAEEYLDTYLEAGELEAEPKSPLFRAVKRVGKERILSANPLHRADAHAMVKRRAVEAGLSPSLCNHSFRATGITAYLESGGTIEKAQQIAGHRSPRTTKLYDRTSDAISLDEIERIIL